MPQCNCEEPSFLSQWGTMQPTLVPAHCCTIWMPLCSGNLCVLASSVCWRALRAGELCVLASSACWLALCAGELCAQFCSFTNGNSGNLRAEHSQMLHL